MNVLIYSQVFHPSVGGVETVSKMLADGLTARGVACRVVTQTPAPAAGQDDPAFTYPVLRHPDTRAIRRSVAWADVVLFNGASLGLQPWVLLARKPFIWVHVGYQASCIDGAGWVDGAPAPLDPLASIRFHMRRSGFVSGARSGLKLLGRRLLAKWAVTRNVAITDWMAQTLPLPRQVRIYNPFPTERFHAADDDRAAEFDFFYMGRLVQEKGVETLIRAFAKVLAASSSAPRLLLIGDGSARPDIESLVDALDVRHAVTFAGTQSGDALIGWVRRGRIGVIPSVWYEPMGGVAVELLAAGKSLIVSAQGGLAECVGDAGLTFPNGDADALATQMLRLLEDETLRTQQSDRARARARQFTPDRFIDEYLALLRELAPA